MQGIGFRPAVYRIASKLGIKGAIANTPGGAEIIIEGQTTAIEKFLCNWKQHLPEGARVASVNKLRIKPRGLKRFAINTTQQGASTTDIPADLPVCPQCLKELRSPKDRRYRYPFINCTNCGPRYTIVKGLPYDRPKTTMALFAMCRACAKEYYSPSDRRFHAEPNACPKCGPNLTLRDKTWKTLARKDNALSATLDYLHDGKIVAIKSLGGYQLACDAFNANAIACLRMRKLRMHKPFAIMLPNVASAKEFCIISPGEQKLLSSPERPIVLLRKKICVARRALPLYDLAPDNAYIGVMLPYTPLHTLLFQQHSSGAWAPNALVMTSGNRTDEPICRTEGEARERLAGIADVLLTHNRPIHNRADDSVVQITPLSNKTVIIRRSRGMVPQPVKLSIPLNTPPIFAAGAELKNTFCLTRANNAYPSVYIGDLDNSEAMAFYQESFSLNKKFLDVKPAIIAHDIHPDYQSTVFASGLLAKNSRLKAVPVQHHHAHIASVMAEHRLVPPLTGIAFDGTGLGFDNTVWGGECFTVDKAGEFIRRAHLGYLALPGGDVASKEIWRMAVSLLTQSGISKMPAHLKIFPARKILKMIKREINSPKCCSVGRLFDAVAAIINLRTECTFEAQAAMELEALAVDTPTKKGYTFALQGGEIPVEPVIRAVYKDFCSGVPAFEISARFHLTLSRIVLMLAKRFKNKTVALSGGVFQNRFLLGMAEQQLLMAGFKVYYNNTVPINDGGISLGQAYIAATNENRKSRIEK